MDARRRVLVAGLAGGAMLGVLLLCVGIAQMFSGGCSMGPSTVAAMTMSRMNDKAKIFQVVHRRLPVTIAELYRGEAPPKDPWGRDFHWVSTSPSGGYALLSLGEDGQLGGEGRAADIRHADAAMALSGG